MFAPESREGVGERVNGATVAQVSRENDVEPLDVASFDPQAVEVTEGLGRVLVAPVAGVDHGNRPSTRVGQARGAIAARDAG